MLTRRRPVLLVLALLAALCSTVALAACGSDSGGSQDPQEVLQKTFTGDKHLDSGKLDVALDLRAKDGSTGQVRLSGPFQSNGAGKVPSFDFTLALSADGQTLDAGFVSTGDAAWVKFRGQSYKLDDKTFQQFASGYSESRSSGGGSTLGALGVDPKRWLSDPKVVGTEDVGGVETTHITAGIRVAPLVADLNRLISKASTATGTTTAKALSPAQLAGFAKALRNVKVDIFTGAKDDTMRRMVVDFDLALQPGKTIVGMTPSGMRLSIGFTDLHQPQTIQAPATSKPFTELQATLTQITELLKESQSGSSGSGSSTVPQTPGGGTKYLNCVNAAAGDIAKLQKCAPLVGQ